MHTQCILIHVTALLCRYGTHLCLLNIDVAGLQSCSSIVLCICTGMSRQKIVFAYSTLILISLSATVKFMKI